MSNYLSAIPSTWESTRLDRVATTNARIGWKALTAAEYQTDGFAFLATPNIKGAEIDFDNANYISDFRYHESPELQLRVGDVLLTKDGFTLGTVNVVTNLPRPATVNGSIAVLRPFGIHPGFLRHAIASTAIQQHMWAAKNGMDVLHLFQRDIKKIPLPLPPENEQRRIADFLDAETSRLDHATTLRNRQKELLHLRRWSHFQHALDSTPSKIMPLRRVLRSVIDGPFGSAFSTTDYTPEGAAVVRLGNIGFAEYKGSEQVRIPSALYEKFRYHEVKAGDVLIAGLGDARNHAGRACVAPELGPTIVKGKCFRARLEEDVADSEYVSLLLSSPLGASAVEGRGSTRSMINLETIRSALLPVPPLNEQQRLAADHRRVWSHTAAAIAACDRQLALLAERRQALITAAVTGQFDVSTASGRNVADGVSA